MENLANELRARGMGKITFERTNPHVIEIVPTEPFTEEDFKNASRAIEQKPLRDAYGDRLQVCITPPESTTGSSAVASISIRARPIPIMMKKATLRIENDFSNTVLSPAHKEAILKFLDALKKRQ